MNVGVGGLDGPEELVLVRLLDEPLAEEPGDLGLGEGLDLALEVEEVALLARGGLAEEGGLDAAGDLLGVVGVLHGEADVVALLAVAVLDGHRVVAGVVLAEAPDRQRAVRPVAAPLQERLWDVGKMVACSGISDSGLTGYYNGNGQKKSTFPV